MEGKLGGFHFNDSKYGDDDLTVGSINPYQLFLIFNELVEGMDARGMNHATDLGWMIDASHNVKDPAGRFVAICRSHNDRLCTGIAG